MDSLKDRTAGEVVEQAIRHFPGDIRDTVMRDLSFSAPEVLLHNFVRLFNHHVPNPPAEEWHYHAIAALMRRTVDEVRAMFPGGEKL